MEYFSISPNHHANADKYQDNKIQDNMYIKIG